MRYKFMMTSFAVLAGLFGIGGLLAPAMMIGGYGVELTSMGYVVYRFWGASMIGLAMVAWLLRGIDDATVQRRMAYAYSLVSFLSTIAAVLGQFNGASDIGWSTVVLFGIISVGFITVPIRKLKADG